MRTHVRFAMHPKDEQLFVDEILRDPNVVFIDGPRWENEAPEVCRTIESIGYYCIIWSPEDMPILAADYIESCNDWYCRSEFATIQFLRSEMHDENILVEGRIAISTSHAKENESDISFAEPLGKRYKLLRKLIKKHYSNSIIYWENKNLPRSPRTPKRSPNPSEKPDSSLWIGPNAVQWLNESPARCIKQNPSAYTEGRIGPQ